MQYSLCCSGYFIGFLNLKKILIFQNILPFVSKGFKNKILKTSTKLALLKLMEIYFYLKILNQSY